MIPISEDHVLVFGGAIERDQNSFVTTNDTFLIEKKKLQWIKLTNSGVVPKNRAAHAMAKIDKFEAIMFGGALVGGTLAREQLYHLKVKGKEAVWNEINTEGEKPGRRYGHTLCFNKPNLILFGGSTGSKNINETWILDLMQKSFRWKKVICPGIVP